jgi:hypothetical protein
MRAMDGAPGAYMDVLAAFRDEPSCMRLYAGTSRRRVISDGAPNRLGIPQ